MAESFIREQERSSGGGSAQVVQIAMAQLPAATAAPAVDVAQHGHDGRVAPPAGGQRDGLLRQRRYRHRHLSVLALPHPQLPELRRGSTEVRRSVACACCSTGSARSNHCNDLIAQACRGMPMMRGTLPGTERCLLVCAHGHAANRTGVMPIMQPSPSP